VKRHLSDCDLYAIDLIHWVCAIAGDVDYFRTLHAEAALAGLPAAVRRHDTPALFDWFVRMASYQGISDTAARIFMEKHGAAGWHEIAAMLSKGPSCGKLSAYWRFEGCRYRKVSFECACPSLIDDCPLPRLPLRNGHLNQFAFSLYLFIRDVAGGDLGAWLDRQILETALVAEPDPYQARRDAVIGPLRNVFGVSDKVLNMTLANLLIGAAGRRRHWIEVGASMIAIDRLVHNFFVRTGVLEDNHPYGARCYQPGGCAERLRAISGLIDARDFNQGFPANFPRFVQSAIWRYCAKDGLDICNGVTIDDKARCDNDDCRLYSGCARLPLRAAVV